MKTLFFFCIMLSCAIASTPITQKHILGNWSMTPANPESSSIVTLINDTLSITDDWKYTEAAHYSVNYPSYGPSKIDLKYNLKISSNGEYRIDNGIRKYQKAYESEIINPTDEAAAKSSLKEIEKLIKEESKDAFPVLSITETEMDLQSPSSVLKFTKPKKLPNSKLTLKPVPFFAPEGWRYPETAKELSDFAIRLKNDKVNLFTMAEADFNGDGAQDAVAYLMNEEGQVALFLNLSQPDGSYSLEPHGSADRSSALQTGVFLAPAGEYANISNKQKFTTEHDGFMVVIFGTAATLNYFDSSSSSWKNVPIGKKF